MSNLADKPEAVLTVSAAPDSSRTSPTERRSSLRFPFTAAAEVMDLKTKARVTGRSSDLGEGGCYVDTLAPFAVGSAVQIRLERGSHVLEATGVVTYALVSMGMGLSFTGIKPEHESLLGAWIAELSGEAPALPEAAPPSREKGMRANSGSDLPGESEQGALSAVVTNRQILNELINLMVRKKLINENEAAALLRQMYR
jgi:PilZ domain